MIDSIGDQTTQGAFKSGYAEQLFITIDGRFLEGTDQPSKWTP